MTSLRRRVSCAVRDVLEESSDVSVRDESGDALADVVDEPDRVAQEVGRAQDEDGLQMSLCQQRYLQNP